MFSQCFICRRPGLPWILGLVFAALAAPAVCAAEPGIKSDYIMGVFPHLPPRELEKVFSPIADDLGKAIERKVVLRTSTTYERFSDNLDAQVYDIAFVQPFDYVRAADHYGYVPLATRTQKLATIIVVKQDSTFTGLKDFRGKRIALPPVNAAVSHLIRAHLREHGLEPGKDVQLSHHRSHVSCMQQVLIGEAAACGTAAPARRFFEHKMGVNLRVVDTTSAIPHTLFTIHPRVPARDRELIKQRILSWADSEAGREMLARGRLKPFVAVNDSEYNIVRAMAGHSD
jgi:phosphonate transport system substrate-binding protein